MIRTKIIMYGAEACPDCVAAKVRLDAAYDAFELDYRDITKSLKTLKEFLSYRDHDAMFAPVVQTGSIGIPFFVLEDQTRTFEIGDILDGDESAPTASACSIDGKHC
jgi:glutaredoxin-related protein